MSYLDRFITSAMRPFGVLIPALVMPLIITYTIPYYWMNALGIFCTSFAMLWLIDFMIWACKKVKGWFAPK